MAFGTIIRSDLRDAVYESMDVRFIGEQVAPVKGVQNLSGSYYKWEANKTQALKAAAGERAENGDYPTIERQRSTGTYTCLDYGLEEIIDDVWKAEYSDIEDALQAASRMTLQNVRLTHEQRVASALLNASTFAATAAKVNYTETLISTIDFAADIQGAIQRLTLRGYMPNAIVMSQVLADQIARSTKFQNFVKGNLPTGQNIIVSDTDIQQAFARKGITSIYVGTAGSDSSKVRGTKSVSSIWSNAYIWVGCIKDGDARNGGAMRTMLFEKDCPTPFTIETRRHHNDRAEIVRCRMTADEVIVDAQCGELITTNYSAS